MTSNGFEGLHCRLYIQFNGTLNILRKNIVNYFGGSISIGTVFDEYIWMYIMNNIDCFPDKIHEHAGFIYYPYVAIVDPYADIKVQGSEPFDTEVYLDILCHVITKLRENGAIVVASCEYENLIVEKTGWNWSEDTPNAPNLT